MTFIIAIVGSQERHWSDPDKAMRALYAYLNEFLPLVRENHGRVEVVSGESPKGGVDVWVRDYAAFNGIPYTGYPPKGELPQGYHARNRAMVKAANVVLAFWGGTPVHSGTLSTARLARGKGNLLGVFKLIREDQFERSDVVRNDPLVEGDECPACGWLYRDTSTRCPMNVSRCAYADKPHGHGSAKKCVLCGEWFVNPNVRAGPETDGSAYTGCGM